MEKQTAVEQFAIALYEKGLLKGNGDDIQELLEQFKEIEKERMKDAWDDGLFGKTDNFQQYYNETFGK